MDVSSFELIYKPQSPVGTADTVLQGYFLNIANLEDTQLIFRADFVTSSVTDPDRSLAGNTVAFIDTPNQNNVPATLDGPLDAPSFRLSPDIVIPARGTAKIAVLPSDPFPVPVTPANFEARGFVTLRLPPLLTFSGGGINVVPQLDRPARVLLTPQNRAVYLDDAGVINDQTQAGLPTATGAAVSEVEAETTITILGASAMSNMMSDSAPMIAPDMEDGAMAMMLAAVSASEGGLKTMNSGLRQAGIGIAVEKRNR